MWPQSAFWMGRACSYPRYRPYAHADVPHSAFCGLSACACLTNSQRQTSAGCLCRRWRVCCRQKGMRAAGDGAFLNAVRLTASKLLFAATPPFTGAWPAPVTSLTGSISGARNALKCHRHFTPCPAPLTGACEADAQLKSTISPAALIPSACSNRYRLKRRPRLRVR